MSTKMNLTRIQGQGCKSRCIFVMECVMVHKLEQHIKNTFKQKFTLHKGSEYFKGDELVMSDIFLTLCVDHKLKYRLNKFEITNHLNITYNIHNYTLEPQNYDEEQNEEIEKTPTKKIYICEFCSRPFNHYQGMWAHKKICKCKDLFSNTKQIHENMAKLSQTVSQLNNSMQVTNNIK